MTEKHVMSISVDDLDFAILQAREKVDGIAAATRVAQWVSDFGEKERDASNRIQRAIEGKQAQLSVTRRDKGE